MCLMKSCQKDFGTPKNLLVITKQSFLLAKKHILFHILVKLNVFNIKLKSIVPEVIQRLCANWPIGDTIMDVNAFLPLKGYSGVSLIHGLTHLDTEYDAPSRD